MSKLIVPIKHKNLKLIPTVKYWNINTKNNITNILKLGWARINRLVISRSKNAKILPLIR